MSTTSETLLAGPSSGWWPEQWKTDVPFLTLVLQVALETDPAGTQRPPIAAADGLTKVDLDLVGRWLTGPGRHAADQVLIRTDWPRRAFNQLVARVAATDPTLAWVVADHARLDDTTRAALLTELQATRRAHLKATFNWSTIDGPRAANVAVRLAPAYALPRLIELATDADAVYQRLRSNPTVDVATWRAAACSHTFTARQTRRLRAQLAATIAATPRPANVSFAGEPTPVERLDQMLAGASGAEIVSQFAPSAIGAGEALYWVSGTGLAELLRAVGDETSTLSPDQQAMLLIGAGKRGLTPTLRSARASWLTRQASEYLGRLRTPTRWSDPLPPTWVAAELLARAGTGDQAALLVMADRDPDACWKSPAIRDHAARLPVPTLKSAPRTRPGATLESLLRADALREVTDRGGATAVTTLLALYPTWQGSFADLVTTATGVAEGAA